MLFIGMRSSFDSSTPNKSFYTFSTDNVTSEIANNSIFSVAYSLYLMKKEKFYKYGDINYEDALTNVKSLNGIENSSNTLIRYQESSFEKKKNVILVILESFGHKYVGHLGGIDTTPNLDKLTNESLYFTNFYATGTRTSWGISSILSGLYPIPSREYVKASKSLNNFYTIASSFKDAGYDTTFLYSGDADFDSMRGFLQSNGFKNVYGKESFNSSLTKYTWGYCDEDLYDKAVSMIKEKKDKPFFLTLLTMSSHEPFDYPKDKFVPYDGAKLEGFENSIKYADFSIGKFIKKLKDSKILENSIVAFTADHNPKAYANKDVPIDIYKIPALIISKEFKDGGKRYDKLASQIDFGATILDIAGVSTYIPTMGVSVLKKQKDSALLLAKKRNFAYLTKEGVVIYKGNKNITTYDYNLTKIDNNKTNILNGLSYIYASKYIYDNKLHKGKNGIK
jgi:phosphoglycerol transferase MdoB-like AlkP superfamily enzyme